jgi:rare lipoprotein A
MVGLPPMPSRRGPALLLPIALTLSLGCSAHLSSGARPGEVQQGDAVWYGREHHGGPTASGERFNMHELTAAHRTLRLGTRVEVTNLRNGRKVVVRINDRGPYTRGRIIDLSYAAARKIDMVQAGVVPVHLRVLHVP